MAIIAGPFVIEPMHDAAVVSVAVVSGISILPFTIETVADSTVSLQAIISGLSIAPAAVEFISYDFSYNIVNNADMLLEVYIQPVKIINQLDQTTEEKVLRPFGITQTIEGWF